MCRLGRGEGQRPTKFEDTPGHRFIARAAAKVPGQFPHICGSHYVTRVTPVSVTHPLSPPFSTSPTRSPRPSADQHSLDLCTKKQYFSVWPIATSGASESRPHPPGTPTMERLHACGRSRSGGLASLISSGPVRACQGSRLSCPSISSCGRPALP